MVSELCRKCNCELKKVKLNPDKTGYFILKYSSPVEKRCSRCIVIRQKKPENQVKRNHKEKMMNGNFCGNLVNEYYVRTFRRIAQERKQRIDSLKTRSEAEQYVAEVRAKIRSVFPFEKWERTPLRPKIVSSLETGKIVCENLMFDSLPDYPVTGNLYRPHQITGKIPAVLHLCGHNRPGKINANGKALNLSLAAQGMAVLAVDPLDQGERFRDPEKYHSQNVWGHNLIGKRLVGCGSWFGIWRTWDAIRALDYLLSRPEVDPGRIYVTGCSGGGTMTSLINAVEDRFAGAVPSCYITTWKRNVENEVPVDTEQVPPGLSAQGIEMADFLIAAAPRPIQISGEINDLFDIRGTREAYEDLRKIYTLLGCEDRVRIFVGPNGHGYWKEQREECRKFLCGLAGLPAKELDEKTLPDVPDEKLKVLNVPTVFAIPGVQSADQRLKEELHACEKNRIRMSESELRKRTAEILKIRFNAPVPDYRILRAETIEEPYFSRFLLESGELPLGVLHLDGYERYQFVFRDEVSLYIPHDSYRRELPPWQREFPQSEFVSFDPLLIGEMAPAGCDLNDSCRQFGALYGSNYHFAACSLMLGHPIAGLMVEGILGALKILRQGGAKKITLIGAGQSSLPALFAAFLGKELIDHTILVNALSSYAALFDQPNPICPQSLIVPGFLKIADLPDLYQSVRPELREDSAFPHLTDPVC